MSRFTSELLHPSLVIFSLLVASCAGNDLVEPGPDAFVVDASSGSRDAGADAALLSDAGRDSDHEPQCNGGCDDENPCTDDVCVEGRCEHRDNSAPCDDGVFCNGSDMCEAGSCRFHSGDPCDDGYLCTEEDTTCAFPLIAARATGNQNPRARFSIECVANGETCSLRGNRGSGPGRSNECSVSCPIGSTVRACCSNGGAPCGIDDTTPSDTRELDWFTATDFVGDDCPSFPSEDRYECEAVVGGSDAVLICSFTD